MATQQSLAKRTEGLGADAVPPPQRPFDFCVEKTQMHTHTRARTLSSFSLVCILMLCHDIPVLILEISLISLLLSNKHSTRFVTTQRQISFPSFGFGDEFKLIYTALHNWLDVITLGMGCLGERGQTEFYNDYLWICPSSHADTFKRISLHHVGDLLEWNRWDCAEASWGTCFIQVSS